MKKLTFIIALFTSVSVAAQDLNWAYSYFYPASSGEVAMGMSSNGKDLIAVAVRWNKDALIDLRYQNDEPKAGHSYIAVYDKDATLMWAVPGVGTARHLQRMMNVHMTADGSVYGLGRFDGKEDFDPSSSKDEVQASNIGSMYIQKFDKDGNYQWVTTTSFSGIPYESTERPNGNLIVAGDCHGDTTQELKDGSKVKIHRGLFVLELDPDGNIINAGSVHAKETNSHYYDIDVDNDGNILLSGCYEEAKDFDLGAGEVWDTSHRSIDAFVAKYDKDLKYLWHRSFGDVRGNTPTWERAYGIEADADGQIYVGGIFSYETDFDPDYNPGKFVLIADEKSQSPDGFILKYDADGNLQWVRHLGGDLRINSWNNVIEVLNLKTDDKHLYLSGSVSGAVDMDPDTGVVYPFHGGTGGSFAWIGQYDLNGGLESVFMVEDTATTIQHAGVEKIEDIELMNGSVVAFGVFQKTVDFDPGNELHLLSTDPDGRLWAGDNDIFLARWDFDTTGSTNTTELITKSLKIYPNPASDRFTVVNPWEGKSNYALLDIHGRIVRSGELKNGTQVVEVSELTSGVYFFELRSDLEILKKKLVIR